jgi:membrane associated rhomboid family serine protease
MSQTTVSFGWRRPSKALVWLMIAIACLWVMFAVAINWADGGQEVFALLAGDSRALFRGHVWRLVTAALLHHPGSPFHPLIVCMLLYFFGAPLEERWGTKRLFMFFAGSSAFAYAIESLCHVLLPNVAAPQWYGGMVMADAATVAWALGARGEIVRLFFVLPVRPMMMVGFLAVWHVVLLIARQPSPEGMIAPFGAMAAGYLFSDGSPLRRFYLQLKLRRLQAEVASMQRKPGQRKRRPGSPDLRVISGGAERDDEPPDKSLLN